jgi:hypothetical protein
MSFAPSGHPEFALVEEASLRHRMSSGGTAHHLKRILSMFQIYPSQHPGVN